MSYEKVADSALRAGFKAGWFAAMTTVAESLAKLNSPVLERTIAQLHRWAKQPPAVETVNLNPHPKGGVS